MMTNDNRTKLLHKLNALRAVIEVALDKLALTKQHPQADVERLTKISDNLENTLRIVNRAIGTLQELDYLGKQKMAAPSGAREYTEMQSVDEYRKFQNMPPITAEEAAGVDIDDLINKLLS